MKDLSDISNLIPGAILMSVVTGFSIAFLLIPKIIAFAKRRELMDKPGGRKNHAIPTPSLGGFGIFVAFIINGAFTFNHFPMNEWLLIHMGCALFLVVGLLDDIMDIRASIKFGIQIGMATMVVVAGIRIESLYGIFGITTLPTITSYVITVLFIVLVTNAFNLIDGINGLAGGLGAINSLIFGVLFFLGGRLGLALSCLSLFGALLGFLRFNFGKAKIFMGDTGSLPMGFFFSIIGVHFIQEHIPSYIDGITLAHPVLVVMALIAIPVLDTIRVFTMRILQRKSPFSADNNHIHHLILKQGFNHKRTSLVLYLVNIVFIGSTFLLHSTTLPMGVFAFLALAVIAFNIISFNQIRSAIKTLERKQESRDRLKEKNRFLVAK